jgi:hypothetical protein
MAAGNPFWKTVPRTSLITFLLGVFFIFSIVGFASDISEMGRQPPLRLLLGTLISGLFPVGYAVGGFALRGKFWKALVPLFIAHFFSINLLVRTMPSLPQPVQMDAADLARLQSRLTLDGLAIMLAVMIGYTCFVYVTITQGRRYFRVRAEIELATEIHQVLVPAIDTKLGEYEFYGRSVPSGEVGGDLIDLAGSQEQWVAYLADVSGHGVAPGVVMGMVKSAARMLLTSGDTTVHLMSRLNEVLFPLKKPDMFATFCFLAKDAEGLQVGLAGHPAILRFSARTGEVSQLESPNMPLGILPSADFAISQIRPEPGDVFALYTDGFLEPANAAGEEFGLPRLQAEFQKAGKQPLSAICQSLQESVSRHGPQFDDQSLLLIRHL